MFCKNKFQWNLEPEEMTIKWISLFIWMTILFSNTSILFSTKAWPSKNIWFLSLLEGEAMYVCLLTKTETVYFCLVKLYSPTGSTTDWNKIEALKLKTTVLWIIFHSFHHYWLLELNPSWLITPVKASLGVSLI